MDVVDSKTRSRMMSGIRSTNTIPEKRIRAALHSKGFRYGINVKSLPGKPDLVLRKYNAVIFVHGCFWHGHDCHLFKVPSTRKKFWLAKIGQNTKRDKIVQKELLSRRWRTCIVWECAFKGRSHLHFERLIMKIKRWILSKSQFKQFV